MCTAITYGENNFYFGRNLDLERSYGEMVVITPRNYPFQFRNGMLIQKHYALIGMAAISDSYPLYFEATNEKGLSLAGLNFPGNAIYFQESDCMDNVAPFELIPWILCQCENVQQAVDLLKRINLWNEPFSKDLPLSPLHWMLADQNRCYTLETAENGIQIFDNPVGVLTNNPRFDYHMQNLTNYLNLTANVPENRFSPKLDLLPYSLGMGAMGLPGDPSSASRFIKATFTKLNSVVDKTEEDEIGQFFHILSSVAQQKGITMVPGGKFEYTMYTSCCNTSRGIYYYTTYYNSRINAVDMHKENLNSTKLICYQRNDRQDILYVNHLDIVNDL